MVSELTTSITSVAIAIVGLAVIAVILSKNANTTGVISSAGTAFSQSLGAAEAPVTGAGI